MCSRLKSFINRIQTVFGETIITLNNLSAIKKWYILKKGKKEDEELYELLLKYVTFLLDT